MKIEPTKEIISQFHSFIFVLAGEYKDWSDVMSALDRFRNPTGALVEYKGNVQYPKSLEK